MKFYHFQIFVTVTFSTSKNFTPFKFYISNFFFLHLIQPFSTKSNLFALLQLFPPKFLHYYNRSQKFGTFNQLGESPTSRTFAPLPANRSLYIRRLFKVADARPCNSPNTLERLSLAKSPVFVLVLLKQERM